MKKNTLFNVTVEGNLRERTELNFSRMQDNIFGKGKAGLPPYCSVGWPGDWEGRSLLANVLDENILGKKSLIIDDLEEWIYSLMNDEGYRSEPNDKLNLEDINEQMHSGQNWLMRAFMEYYLATGNEKYLDTVRVILKKLYLPIKPHLKNYPRTAEDRKIASDCAVVGHTMGNFKEWRLSSDIGCIFMCFDALGQALQIISDEPLRSEISDLIDELLDAFKSVDYVGACLQTHATLTCMRGIMRVYKVRKDRALLNVIENFFEDYTRFGMTAGYENVNLFLGAGHTEPCGIIDAYMLCMQLWEETEKTYYLEYAHRIWFNGVMRTQRENGGFGCDWTGKDGLLYPLDSFYEAYWCCSMRGAEGLGYPTRNALYEDNGSIVLPFFFDFTAESDFGTLKFETEYPLNGRVRITVLNGNSEKHSIKLFAPSFVNNYSVSENGKRIPFYVSDSFAVVDAEFTAGNVYEYSFDLKLYSVDCNYLWHGKDEETILYGPLVLGTDEKFDCTPRIEKFKQIGEGKFEYEGHIFEPFFNSYIFPKHENIKRIIRIVFKK